MLTLDFDYIVLYLLMFLIFWIAGRGISKNGNYWLHAIWCVLIFTFVSGSRYMRGNDYARYVHTFLHDDDPHQLCFTFLNQTLRSIGIDQYSFFYIYAIMFIVAALIFLKRYRQYAEYMFPIFLAAFLMFDEYCIRQALGFSFVFLYLYHFISLLSLSGNESNGIFNAINKKHIPYCVIYAILAYSIHSANAINIVVMTGMYLFIRFPIPWKISIPLYLFSAYVLAKSFDWSILTNVLSYLGGQDELFSQYTENADFWFSDERVGEDWQRNPIIKFMETMGNCSLFYLGSKVIRQKFDSRQDIVTYYNMYVIGAILVQMFFTNEIMRRMSGTLNYFWFIPLTLVIYHYKDMKFSFAEKIFSLFLVFWCWDIFRYIFMAGKMTLFLWDK